MKKILISITAFLFIAGSTSYAQTKYFTRNGKISFDATASSSPEKIQADNDKASSVLDAATGQLEFAVLIKAFIFERALMQEHFNENYMESDKFPKATFKGTVANMSTIDLTKDGSYKAKIAGQLTLHGVTKDVATEATLTVKSGVVNAQANFSVLLTDFNIAIPTLVKDKVGSKANITADVSYSPLSSKIN